MALTPAQRVTLKAHILANANTIPAGYSWSGGFVGQAINALPNTPDANNAIAGWYSLVADPVYAVWSTAVTLKALRAAADIGKYTPSDSPDDTLTYQNRAMLCQLKQANAFFLLQGEGVIDATSGVLRASFNDCMTAIPAGAGGGNVNAGWGAAASPGPVRLAMQRAATNVEKLFGAAGAGGGAAGNVGADPRGSATNPDALVVVGGLGLDDVRQARELP